MRQRRSKKVSKDPLLQVLNSLERAIRQGRVSVATMAYIIVVLFVATVIVFYYGRRPLDQSVLGIFISILIALLTAPLVYRFITRFEELFLTITAERGARGVLSSLALYRERVISRFSKIESAVGLGTFRLDQMYVPIELEVREAESKVIQRQQPYDLLRSHRHLAIIGDPGSGKTTMLQYLTYLSARGQLAGLPDIPIYISLSKRSFLVNDIVGTARRNFLEEYHIYLSRDDMTRLFETGFVIILLDGLDEAGPEYFKSIQQYIDTTLIDFPKLTLVLASRPYAFNNEIQGLTVSRISPLSEENIQTFVSTRLSKSGSRYVEDLSSEILSNEQISRLSKIPLFLTLIIWLYERQHQIPKNKLELYRQCSDLLLYKWDQIRNIRRRLIVPQQLKLEFLMKFGLFLQQNNEASANAKQLLKLISASFPVELYRTPQTVLNELVFVHGIIAHETANTYRFVHLGFQEYFAATEIAAQGELPEYLTNNITEPWWKEVVVLLASLGYADEILERLLSDTSNFSDKLDTIYRAAEIIAASSRTSQLLREKLLRRSERKFELSHTSEAISLAYAMIDIDFQEAIEYLHKTLSSNKTQFSKVAAAMALSAYSKADSQITDLLLDALSNSNLKIRAEAAKALGNLKTNIVMGPLVSALKLEKSEEVQLALLRAIRKIIRIDEPDWATMSTISKIIKNLISHRDQRVSSLASDTARILKTTPV